MNRRTAPVALAALWLALLLPGCPEKEPVDARQALVELAMESRREGLALMAEGNSQAAQESMTRAYRHALDAVTAEGAMARQDLLNALAELCCQLGRWSPAYLGRAVRYCQMAIETGPGWGLPYVNLGLAYEAAGLYDDAVRAFDRFFELAPREQFPDDMWESLQDNLVRALFLSAGEIMREDQIGAEGRARAVLERAFALRPAPSSAPQVHNALAAINAEHQRLTRAAAEQDDGLEIVRIHARFGFPVPAETALANFKATSGSNRDVRFVEARYVLELAGTPESLRRAAEIYLDLLSRGELVVHAAAGYCRTMLALGEGEKALERLGDFPNPSSELRRALILLRLDRIAGLPAEAHEAAAAEFDKIAELSTGGLEVFDRARLYWLSALTALDRKDAERMESIIRTYQIRFPQDPRVAILDAELQELRGIPVEEVFAEVKDA
jgi:tetratricopeptide (TPR) repeat protein